MPGLSNGIHQSVLPGREFTMIALRLAEDESRRGNVSEM
jgi:hypothetical protein